MGVAFAVNALGSFPIIVGGTEEQKQRWLPQIAAGEKLVAFCLSEKFAGSDAGVDDDARPRRTATTTSSTARRSGPPTAASATIYTVFA